MSLDLKQARIDLGYSIDDVANHLKIRKKYLLALEESRYDLLPGEAYVIGYLNSYCKFLKIQTQHTDLTNSPNKIIVPNEEVESGKARKYLLIISMFSLIMVSIIYHQLFYVTTDDKDDKINDYSASSANQNSLE